MVDRVHETAQEGSGQGTAFVLEAGFWSDPLLPPPSSFLPQGWFREQGPERRVPCYMLGDYFVGDPAALPPSAYFPGPVN